MSIKDDVILVVDEQVTMMYWRMRDLWGSINLVAYVTAWSNSSRYSKVVVRGRMR
jgi:hypothetical protein